MLFVSSVNHLIWLMRCLWRLLLVWILKYVGCYPEYNRIFSSRFTPLDFNVFNLTVEFFSSGYACHGYYPGLRGIRSHSRYVSSLSAITLPTAQLYPAAEAPDFYRLYAWYWLCCSTTASPSAFGSHANPHPEILANIGRNPFRFKLCLVACNLRQAIQFRVSPDWQLDFR